MGRKKPPKKRLKHKCSKISTALSPPWTVVQSIGLFSDQFKRMHGKFNVDTVVMTEASP